VQVLHILSSQTIPDKNNISPTKIGLTIKFKHPNQTLELNDRLNLSLINTSFYILFFYLLSPLHSTKLP